MKRLVLLLALIAIQASAQVVILPAPGGGGSGTVTGGACPGAPDQMVVSISSTGVPTCSKVTSAFVDSTVVAVGGAAGTPASINLTNGTALPIATGVSGLGANVAGVLAVFSSANLRIAVTDESGTGPLLFAGGNIGAATGQSLSLSGLGGSGTRCVQVDNTGALAVAASACGGSGSTTALDNLAAVNINTSLLAQAGVDLGSTTKQFRDLFLFGSGTYGSTYIRLTGAPTGARVLTLPNQTGTLVYSGGPIDLTGGVSATLPIAAIGNLSSGMATYLAAATVANFSATAGSQTANCVIGAPDGTAGNLACIALTYGYLPQAVPITKLTTGTTIASYNGTYQLNCGSPCTQVLPPVAAHPGTGFTFINIAGSSTVTIDGNSAEQICDPSGCANTKTIAANAVATLMADADATQWRFVSQAVTGGTSPTVFPKAPGLRITTQSGTCKSTADRTAQATLYYTPAGDCGGSSYAVAYSGSAWVEFTQAELSLSLTMTSGKIYDVYYCYNSGTPSLSLSAAWTNDGTRSEAQGKQDGFLVKGSDHTCLNVGLTGASGTNTTEDSAANAFVWNRFVKMPHDLHVIDTTDDWTYTTATWRQANANAANQVSYVTGDIATSVTATVTVGWTGSTNSDGLGAAVAVGVDSTSSPTGSIRGNTYSSGGAIGTTLVGRYNGAPGLGKHTLVWLEIGDANGTSDFLGDDAHTVVQSGIDGTLLD